MPLSAWLMFLFGCLILYGGLAWCITIAICHHDNQPPPPPAAEANR